MLYGGLRAFGVWGHGSDSARAVRPPGVNLVMIVREVFANGLCLLTESMPDVRSVSVGVWLTRGSRHEDEARGGIAHFIEHMLFKGTATRSVEGIAQEIDSMGGLLDAFTAKECASYYIKVLDEHLPRAVDILADIVLNPAFHEEDIEREKKVVVEEIKMVEDTPDDLVHELFTQHFWQGHPLGRPILGTSETVGALTQESLREYFRGVYVARNFIVAAAGHVEHDRFRELISGAFGAVQAEGQPVRYSTPTVVPKLLIRNKELGAESHLPWSERLPAGSRRPVRQLHPQHRAWRLDELAPVPERAGETRARLRGGQQPERVSRYGFPDRLRRLRHERGR